MVKSKSLFRKVKNYFIGYSFIRIISEGQFYNSNILLKRNISKKFWAGKISRKLPKIIPNYFGSGKNYIRTVDFNDINDRALLGFRLAKLAGVKTLKAKIVRDSLINGFDFNTIDFSRIDDNVFLTEYRGVSLPEYLDQYAFKTINDSDIKNKSEILKSLVFKIWIGCYDCKDEDFLVDKQRNIIPIDYHLFGPGFKSSAKLAVGAWGEAFDIDNCGDTGWCAGGDRVVEYIKSLNLPAEAYGKFIKKIILIKSKDIKTAMKGLIFCEQGTNKKINDYFYDFLLERRIKIDKAIKEWINSDYAKGRLPKNNGVI